jgi:hypothetical protein
MNRDKGAGLQKIFLGFLVLGSLAAANAQGLDLDIFTGNGFERVCSVIEKVSASNFQPTDKDLATVAYCTGYVSGVEDGVIVVTAAMDADSVTAADSVQAVTSCATKDVPLGQRVKVVLKYIRDNPDRAHFPTSLLAAEALHKAFPCSDPSGQTKKKK